MNNILDSSIENEFLKREFYYDKNGKLDLIPKSLNCINGTLYFHCRLKLGESRQLSTMFMINLGICLVKDSTGKSVHFGSAVYAEEKYFGVDALPTIDAFNIVSDTCTGINALTNIERQLEEGKVLSLDTFCYRMPFYYSFKSSDASYSKEDYPYRHYILLIGQTAEDIFYIEDPDHINYERYRPHEENKYVGRINKSELLKGLEAYSECVDVGIDLACARYYTSRSYYVDFLKSFVTCFESGVRESNEHKALYGTSCFDSLLNLFSLPQEELELTLSQFDSAMGCSVKTFLSWQFHDIVSARKIFMIVTKVWVDEIPQLQKVILALEYSLITWGSLSESVGMGSTLEGEKLICVVKDSLMQARALDCSMILAMKQVIEDVGVGV